MFKQPIAVSNHCYNHMLDTTFYSNHPVFDFCVAFEFWFDSILTPLYITLSLCGVRGREVERGPRNHEVTSSIRCVHWC